MAALLFGVKVGGLVGIIFVNIFIKGYPVALISYARDLFGQSLVSIILGITISKAAERALPRPLKG